MKNFGLASSLIALTFLSGCLNTDIPDTSAQLALDVQKIEKYLDDNNITNFVKDASGIFYVINQAGGGNKPLATDHVNMTYVAKLMDETLVFEQTEVPVFLTVNNITISGLRIALPKFEEGTIATIYVPSVLAYGTGSSPTIPANSNLIFDIELFNVVSTTTEILEIQKGTIDQYVLENEIQNVQIDPSGLRYIIHEEGTGPKPTLSNSVSVKYKGTFFSNGDTFDETTLPRTFTLSDAGLIEGWKIGMQLLPEGSKATFYIPSGLGYGTGGSGTIPPHAILVFEVELVEVI